MNFKIYPITTFLFILSILKGFSQPPTIEWEQSIGGVQDGWANSVQQTTDGGFIATGTTANSPWVAKISTNGSLEWQNPLSIPGDFDELLSIQQTTEGGYIAAGYSTQVNGLSDYWIVKLDAEGDIEWQKLYGGSDTEIAEDIQQTADGGYIVAGHSYSNDGDVSGNHGDMDYWIVKLDALGVIEWQKSLGGSEEDWAKSIQQTTDGGYIVAGYTFSSNGNVSINYGGYDYWIVKLDATGVIEWQKSLGGTGYDFAHSIQQTVNGGYIIAGQSDSNDGDVSSNQGDFDYWVVKIDALGTIEWGKAIGGSSYEFASCVQQTVDGGYIVGGHSYSNDGDVSGHHGDIDYWIIKFNAMGVVEWQKSLGGSGYDRLSSIQQTSDGGYIIGGSSNSNDGDISANSGETDIWLVKLSATALPIDLISFHGSVKYDNALLIWNSGIEERFSHFELQKSIDGRAFTVLATVPAKGNNTNYSHVTSQSETLAYYRLKMIDKDGTFAHSDIIKLQQQRNDTRLVLYPNPVSNIVYVKADKAGFATIFNAAGALVKKLLIQKGVNNIDVSELSKGIYYFSCDGRNRPFIKY